MDLKGVKKVTDKGSHFLVEHDKIGSFKVAKKGLNKNTHTAIQKFADGGDVVPSGGTLQNAVALQPVNFKGAAQAQPYQATQAGNPFASNLGDSTVTAPDASAFAAQNIAAKQTGAGKENPAGSGAAPDDPLADTDQGIMKGIVGLVAGPFAGLINPLLSSTPQTSVSDGLTSSGSPNSQNYAKGGVVKKYAGGGEEGSPESPFPKKVEPFGGVDGYYTKRDAVPGERFYGSLTPPMSEGQPASFNNYLGQWNQGSMNLGSGAAPAIAEPSSTPPRDVPEPNDPAPATAQPQQNQFAMPQGPQPTGPGMDGLNRAFDAEKRAVQAGADVDRQQGDANAEAYQHVVNAQQIASKTFDDASQKLQAQHDALRQGILDTKIDPQRLWSSQTTGGKVQSILGIMLSGVGAGLSHQPNQAIETLDKLTAQDIDAQKAELGKKENLLSENLKATGDLRLAQQMTQAQLLTGLQTQLGMTASKFGGAKAQAAAQLIGSQIDQKREMLRIQIGTTQGQAAQQAYQQRIQADALGRLYNGQGTPVDEVVGGKSDSTVTNPLTGMRSLAHDKESAKEYREQSAVYGSVRDIVSELKQNAKEMSVGTLDMKKRAEMQTKREALALQLPAALAGLKRLNENEYNAAIKAAPDPSEILQSHAGVSGKLEALGSMLDNRQRTINNQYLIQPSTKQVK